MRAAKPDRGECSRIIGHSPHLHCVRTPGGSDGIIRPYLQVNCCADSLMTLTNFCRCYHLIENFLYKS